jgi:hypothetical protein
MRVVAVVKKKIEMHYVCVLEQQDTDNDGYSYDED